MSMNLYVYADVTATLHLSTGDVKQDTREECSLWQTPTLVTQEILATPGGFDAQIEAYVRWAQKSGKGSKDHVAAVRKWVADHKGWRLTAKGW